LQSSFELMRLRGSWYFPSFGFVPKRVWKRSWT
jgi:hypothetical protein